MNAKPSEIQTALPKARTGVDDLDETPGGGASLGAFFIGQEAAAPDSEVPSAREIAALREDIAVLLRRLEASPTKLGTGETSQ